MLNRYFETGGALNTESQTYVPREADNELYSALVASEYCYVLAPRQTGKSSLRVRVTDRLRNQSVACATIDISSSGKDTTAQGFYCNLITEITKQIALPLDALDWWRTYQGLDPTDRFGKFIETQLLEECGGSIVIFIDEIDSILKFQQFDTDAFFNLIRSFYNRRADFPRYCQLTLCLLGVATPFDLIKDSRVTSFNVGKGIKLRLLEFENAQPILRPGLEKVVENPDEVLAEIFRWSKGQPFLTQRLCQLIVEDKGNYLDLGIAPGIEKLIKEKIIRNWENQDKQVHLSTISKRVTESKRAVPMLNLYQQILEEGSILLQNTPEQAELKVSGLVRQENDFLVILNPIYRHIFNETWLHKELMKLSPFQEAKKNWLKNREESWLLRGRALRDALEWADSTEVKLNEEDTLFLEESKLCARTVTQEMSEKAMQLSKAKTLDVLKDLTTRLESVTQLPQSLIEAMESWTGENHVLVTAICERVLTESQIPKDQENQFIHDLIETWLRSRNEPDDIRQHFNAIQDDIRGDDKGAELIELYQQILLDPNSVLADGSQELGKLIEIGLIRYDGEFHVANPIYERVFNLEWVEQHMLPSVAKRRVFGTRYQVIRDLRINKPIQVYKVRERFVPGSPNYILKYFSLPSTQFNLIEDVRAQFFQVVEGLKIASKNCPQIPTITDQYGVNNDFYLVEEIIEGKTLDEKIQNGCFYDELDVIRLLIELMKILSNVHEYDIAHLNIKPANLFFNSQDNTVYLVDFSNLKQVYNAAVNPELREQIGTSGYIPPEGVIAGKETQCDLYSAGMLAIQVLTGLDPANLICDAGTGKFLWRYLSAEHPLSAVSNGFAEILDRMIHPDSTQRYPDAQTVLDELQRFKNKRALLGSIETWCRRNSVKVGATATILMAIVGVSIARIGFASQRVTDIATCREMITSNRSNSAEIFDIEVAVQAGAVYDACDRLIKDKQSNALNLELSMNKGKAALILWQVNSKLIQRPNNIFSEHEFPFLHAAKLVFSTTLESAGSETLEIARSYFYLGLIKQITNDLDYENDYESAIEQYLNLGRNLVASVEDRSILIALTFYLTQWTHGSIENSQALAEAQRLMEMACVMDEDESTCSVEDNTSNIILNYASLVAQRKDYGTAERYLEAFIEEETEQNELSRDIKKQADLEEARRRLREINRLISDTELESSDREDDEDENEDEDEDDNVDFQDSESLGYLPVYFCNDHLLLAILDGIHNNESSVCYF